MIRKLITFIKQAGAASEQSTDRQGFLSYHAESHAVAVGLGAGFLLTLSGNGQLLGAVIGAISAGLRGESSRQPTKILTDVYQEPHYAIGGLVVGVILGALVGLLV